MSILHQLTSIIDRPKKRLGRGIGSGKGGHTVGRGSKGQGSRVGSNVPLWFEGGQLPLVKRLPMWRGKSRFESLRPAAEITLSDLEKMSESEISLETLKLKKVIETKFKKAKVIATGELKRSVVIKGMKVSAQAKKAIEAAGGKVI